MHVAKVFSTPKKEKEKNGSFIEQELWKCNRRLVRYRSWLRHRGSPKDSLGSQEEKKEKPNHLKFQQSLRSIRDKIVSIRAEIRECLKNNPNETSERRSLVSHLSCSSTAFVMEMLRKQPKCKYTVSLEGSSLRTPTTHHNISLVTIFDRFLLPRYLLLKWVHRVSCQVLPWRKLAQVYLF